MAILLWLCGLFLFPLKIQPKNFVDYDTSHIINEILIEHTWLGLDLGVVIAVAVVLNTVGIVSDWPWNDLCTIQFFGSQICVNQWKVLVGILTALSSFDKTGSL